MKTTTSMAPTILIAGATGNTGKGVVETLPELLKKRGSEYRILGLTRSVNSPTSKKLAALPNVEMEEKDWTTIDAAWLRSRNVVRVFIAPHNQLSQFAEESAFHVALLEAGVKYVVRISTNSEYISPKSPIFYGRAHWAIENLLSQPEFESLHWTSLQPNFFSASYLASASDWIKEYQKTGKQAPLTTTLAEDVPVAMIDPLDVGAAAAHLLALEDTSPHNQARYIVSGPEDVTGKRVVELVDRYVGARVEKIAFKVTSFLNDLVAAGVFPAKVLPSIMAGFKPLWDGRNALAGTPTSPEIMQLAPPKRTMESALKELVEG